MKPRKLTKTMKEQMARAKESRAIKSQMRREAASKPFSGMKVAIQADLYKSTAPSVDHGGHSTSNVTVMAERYKESPEIRAEIERKANCLVPAYNKGAVQYISDKEAAKCAGRKNVD